MRILTVHNRYLIRGGEDESRESEDALMRSYGHEIFEYVEDNRLVEKIGALQTGLRSVWSQQTYRSLRQYLRALRPDVLDVHNFFPLVSPSVYYAARDEGVPVVQTLHNFRLLCPGALFFRDGHTCEKCLKKTVQWPGIFHGCYRNNRLATAAVATMNLFHRFMGTWDKMVDRYIVLSQFSRRKFIDGGLPESKMVVKPNFVYPDPGVGVGSGGYGVFVGRLSHEKGLETLLKAWKKAGKNLPLKIIGGGPLLPMVQEAATANPNITCLGRRSPREVYQIVGEAGFLVFPSECYETFGRVAVEAFAKGTPVIVSNHGSMAELVEDGRTGLHFQTGDSDSLADAITKLNSDPALHRHMRQQAREEFVSRYTAQRNYQMLLDIYHGVLSRKPDQLRAAA